MERPKTKEEGISRGPMRNRLLPRSSEAEPQKREDKGKSKITGSDTNPVPKGRISFLFFMEEEAAFLDPE